MLVLWRESRASCFLFYEEMNFVVICLSQSSLVLIADHSLVLSSLQFCPKYKNVIVLALQYMANNEVLIALPFQSKSANSKYSFKFKDLDLFVHCCL